MRERERKEKKKDIVGPLSRSTIGAHEPYVVRFSAALRLTLPCRIICSRSISLSLFLAGRNPTLRPMNYPELPKIASNFRQPARHENSNSSSFLFPLLFCLSWIRGQRAVASATCCDGTGWQVNAVVHVARSQIAKLMGRLIFERYVGWLTNVFQTRLNTRIVHARWKVGTLLARRCCEIWLLMIAPRRDEVRSGSKERCEMNSWNDPWR